METFFSSKVWFDDELLIFMDHYSQRPSDNFTIGRTPPDHANDASLEVGIVKPQRVLRSPRPADQTEPRGGRRSMSPEAILSSSAFPSLEDLPTGQHYKPVLPFWFHRLVKLTSPIEAEASHPSSSSKPLPARVPNIHEPEVHQSHGSGPKMAPSAWQPFTAYDSAIIEHQYSYFLTNPTRARTIVHTDGGRYDVDLVTMTRRPVYWTDADCVCEVRRCSWYYVNSVDETYVPYEFDIAQKLEHEYRKGIASDQWNRRIEITASKDFFVMYDANNIVHTKPACKRDEWGSVFDGKVVTQIVKRGIENYKFILDGTPIRIDHVIFIIHGIGEFCDFKFRTITQCVDGMRDISERLLKSHFKDYIDQGVIGRVEMIPCNWHKILHSESTGVDSRLQSITLSTIRKLREYTNDTLVDILFYTSPIYCQTIIDTVSNELNRLYSLFIERNPGYTGTYSIIGHSLGSLIAFDLLSHQNDNNIDQRTASLDSSNKFMDDDDTSDTLSQTEPNKVHNYGVENSYKSTAEAKTSFHIGEDIRENSIVPYHRPLRRLSKCLGIKKSRSCSAGLLHKSKLAKVRKSEKADMRSEIFRGDHGLTQLLNSLNISPDIQIKLLEQNMDIESLFLCDEADLKNIGITMGPRKKIIKYLSSHQSYQSKILKKNRNSSSFSDLSTISSSTDRIKQREEALPSSRRRSLVTLDEMTNQEEAPTSTFGFTVGTAGTGQPYVSYQLLQFNPTCFFALGSPIGLFLTIRGIELIGSDYSLPTCPHFINVFHPLDPVAFRIEPLVLPCIKLPPVQIPHHKGRKRIHLELQENLHKMSFDLKQGLFQTFKSTLNSLQNIAFAKAVNTLPNTQLPVNQIREGLEGSYSTTKTSGHQNFNNGKSVVEQPSTPSRPSSSLLSRMLRSASIQYSSKSECLKNDLLSQNSFGAYGEVYENEDRFNNDQAMVKLAPRSSRLSLQIADMPLLNHFSSISQRWDQINGKVSPRPDAISTGSNYQSASESGGSLTSLNNQDFEDADNESDNYPRSIQNDRSPSSSSLFGGNPAQGIANIERYIQTVSDNALRMNKNISFSGFSASPPERGSSTSRTYNDLRNLPASQASVEVPMGKLNSGDRIDYILQEKPIEAFNEYIFALHSHVCYWESEDTILLILNQLYALKGITGAVHSTLLEELTSYVPTLFSKKS